MSHYRQPKLKIHPSFPLHRSDFPFPGKDTRYVLRLRQDIRDLFVALRRPPGQSARPIRAPTAHTTARLDIGPRNLIHAEHRCFTVCLCAACSPRWIGVWLRHGLCAVRLLRCKSCAVDRHACCVLPFPSSVPFQIENQPTVRVSCGEPASHFTSLTGLLPPCSSRAFVC